MQRADVEVVWPLHEHHYLTTSVIGMRSDMATADTETSDLTSHAATDRDSAARALLATAGCPHNGSASCLRPGPQYRPAAESDLLAALQNLQWSPRYGRSSPTVSGHRPWHNGE